MNRSEITPATNPCLRHTFHNPIPIQPKRHAHHINKPTNPTITQAWRGKNNIRTSTEAFVIRASHPLALLEYFLEPHHLRQTQRAVDLRDPVVVPQLAMLEPIVCLISTLIAQSTDPPRDCFIPRDNHPALGGGYLLVGIERENPSMPDRAHPTALILGSDRFAGILDNHQSMPRSDFQNR